jgi:hypothetical protein
MRWEEGEGMARFAFVVFSAIFAQAAADILIWHVSGWQDSSLVHFTVITGILVAVLVIAAAIIVRARIPGRRGIAYLGILLLSLMCTAVDIIIITDSSSGAREEHWTVSTASGGIAVAVLVSILFMTTAIYIFDSYTASYFLDFLSWAFLQRLSPGYGAVGQPSEAEITSAVPAEYPSDERRNPDLEGSAELYDRVTAWVEAIQRENSRLRPQEEESREEELTPVRTEAGLIRLRDRRVKLAVIKYYPPALLFRAMRRIDKRIKVDDQVFWVIARPWLVVAQGGHLSGDGHCWVTFGEGAGSYGVVTSTCALSQPNATKKADVRTRAARTELSGTVAGRSDVMKAALIEITNGPEPQFSCAQHTPDARIGPIRLCLGRDQLDGLVVALSPCSKGDFRTRDPWDEPLEAATVTFTVFNKRGRLSKTGDSGSLVLDTLNEKKGRAPAPYLIYLGTNLLASGQEECGLLLEQVSHHWQINTKFNQQSEYNSINISLPDDQEGVDFPYSGPER